MSFNWDSEPNGARYPGHAYSTSGAPGVGQHGSMSKHELNNVLFARGPSFKTNVKITNPSGNTDLTPTVLSILGISSGEHLDGRVLREALVLGPEPSAIDWSQESFQAERSLADKLYRQEITISRVGDTTYVDQGCVFTDTA
jgi:arylsulfatase A-like enzyme